VQLLGHKNVATTMIYTHVCNKPGLTVRSPLDDTRRAPDLVIDEKMGSSGKFVPT